VRKLDEGKYDAIVLALAGLKRMGLDARVTSVIETDAMLPAVAQGALAVETRADDPLREKIAKLLDHAYTRRAVTAERAFLARLDGGCQLPVAAHARVEGAEIVLQGLIAAQPVKGIATRIVRRTARGSNPERLGRDLAESLLFGGGREILKVT
jgi:hydroxymethylbilane synthase